MFSTQPDKMQDEETDGNVHEELDLHNDHPYAITEIRDTRKSLFYLIDNQGTNVELEPIKDDGGEDEIIRVVDTQYDEVCLENSVVDTKYDGVCTENGLVGTKYEGGCSENRGVGTQYERGCSENSLVDTKYDGKCAEKRRVDTKYDWMGANNKGMDTQYDGVSAENLVMVGVEVDSKGDVLHNIDDFIGVVTKDENNEKSLIQYEGKGKKMGMGKARRWAL